MRSKGSAALGQLTIFCVVGMAAAVVPLAEAHTKHIESQHQLVFTPDVASDVFTGTVSSTKGTCERGRSITLFRKVGDASVPDAVVGTATTNSDGAWSEEVTDPSDGIYYAKAAKKVVKRSRHKHICDAAKSNPVVVTVDLGDEDFDADGFTPNQGDCDDDNSAVNPDRTEVDNGTDDDCDGQVDEGFDVDADGFTGFQGDCDDNNPAVNPEAAEVENAIDDDCDGQVDEGVGQNADADVDGFTPNQGDCDDSNSAVNPDQTEVENGIDDNCDGQVDEGFGPRRYN